MMYSRPKKAKTMEDNFVDTNTSKVLVKVIVGL